MKRWNTPDERLGLATDSVRSANPRASWVAGFQIAAIWIMVCCIAIVLLGACGSASPSPVSEGTTSEPETSENAEATGVDHAPTPAASATTPADPTPTPSKRVGQPSVVAVEPPTETESAPTESAGTVEAAEQDPEQQPAASADIRDVDFRNGFAYRSSMGDGDTVVTVTNGEFLNGEFGDIEFFSFFASRPVFGDLDGDGSEEAAVVTSWNGGGSGFFDALHVFGLEADDAGGHVVVVRDRKSFGDRAFGGVWNTDVIDDQLVIDVFIDGDGSCCPHTILRERYDLEDHGLALATSFEPLRWVSPQGSDIEEVTFLPDTSSAVVSLWLHDTVRALTFDAAAGQHVSFDFYKGPVPQSVILTHDDSAQTVVVPVSEAAAEATVVLPESGIWLIEATFADSDLVDENTDFTTQPGATNFVLSITNNALVAGDYSSIVRQVVVQEAPRIVASASWPDFGTSDGGILGGEIREWVNQPVDQWIAYAVESLPLPRPDEGGDYQLHHRVSLVTEDFVSVSFSSYEYLCCRPYPNLGQRSLIVDVTNRRIVADSEIVDLSRLDEVEAAWLQALEADDEWDIEPSELFGGGEEPGWASLTLSPGGLTFGTNRSGALPPMSTFVSFAELGDLVDPEIVRQVTNGAVPTGF